MAADRYNIHSQLEHLQSKYVGTGHADITKLDLSVSQLLKHFVVAILAISSLYLYSNEWIVNQHRDSFASYIGHPNLTEFFSIAENESKARVKFNFLQKMLQPCGPPPEKDEDD